MRQILRNIKNRLHLEKHYLKECYIFWQKTRKYNASNHTIQDKEKMQYTLLRLIHTIEKGMSMKNPRRGFGQAKVLNIIKELNIYVDRYLDKDKVFLYEPMSTVEAYIKYTLNSGVEIPEIEEKFAALKKRVGFEGLSYEGGVKEVSKQAILEKCNKDFESLLYSRHSIRYFTNTILSKDIIDKALTLASRKPSACNRQGWKTHVYQGNKCTELLTWQGGARGFEKDIHNAILVTANLKAFLSYEIHQAYIDGGLYAMNLINALHSLGLGTIPLSCGFEENKLKRLEEFGVSENEVPIVIIGFGELPRNFNPHCRV